MKKHRMKAPPLHRGSDAHKSKLTADAVLSIYREMSAGAGSTAVGQKYGVARTSIQRIMNGRSWGHVTGKLRLPHTL